MSFMIDALAGKQIHSVLADSELVYIMLTNGTQVTVRGVMIVEPKPSTVPGLAAEKNRQIPT